MVVTIRKYLEALPAAVRAMLLGGNLVSLGLIQRPQEMLRYTLENLFLYRSITGSHRLPQRNVFEALPYDDGVINVELANLKKFGGQWFGVVPSFGADLMSLCLLARLLKPKTIFEIGTLHGYTALHLALNVPDAKMYTLDLPRDITPSLHTTAMDEGFVTQHSQVQQYAFTGLPVANRIHCLFGDSATFDYSPFHHLVDLFFIDGAHSYDYVRSDTLKALECCRAGSVIAWHDFGRAGVNGVSKWLKEFSEDNIVYVIPGGSLAYHLVGQTTRIAPEPMAHDVHTQPVDQLTSSTRSR